MYMCEVSAVLAEVWGTPTVSGVIPVKSGINLIWEVSMGIKIRRYIVLCNIIETCVLF